MHSRTTYDTHPNASAPAKLKALLSRSAGAQILMAFALSMTLAVVAPSTALARRPPKAPVQTPDPIPAGMTKITEVDAASIKVAVGTSGESSQSFAITAATKVTVNGVAANARDLKAGMIAKIEPSADGRTAVTITAQDPPAHPGRNRVG